ncbi:aldehyde dehydrogenase family protein [Peribacillus butanolivorans]|uniref:aldehyde dehydrogenase family protein n=1 Tax=Peribacillus TaxID=2675229 RepID=UPI000701391B|nr:MULTISPECIES: aldehyde dehydrogenase family protein [unclassified Peribacillus]KQU23233.1 betaine-aldehyde dehydrogenase [Bacillus sp. Leaf13]MBK5444752.1 aldehyde dehydrogenase family protein [Peribacillus sp. TH24]MBK5460544.1 aldehyde dehydrogenase family protein [Peribacillus sp. TH27]MBK5482334.1 aldehyde dehydrogenase family protein [Peribacillus sp. TH16]MBK5498698.1 aldehyde dehydrogenase family protein [Peribacillus sp. TH14]
MQETLQNNTQKEGTEALDLKMFINGEWVSSTSGEKRDVLNPATGEVIATAAEGTQKDVDAAVEAAKYAFYEGGWWGTPAVERARLLFKIADKLEEKAEELAALETLDNGKPLREARFDIDDAAACFRYYAGLATKPTGQTYEVPDGQQAMVVREPIGVCGQIIPWNFPLLMSAWKLAPALAAGNSVVFKPSEVTPVTAVKLFEILEEVGVPKGVANLVLGAGPVVGQAIAEHEEIDKVAFTGGTATGRKIMEASLGNLKKVTLELGGKSPNIVFADSDFETAVDYALFGIFCNQGQVCSAGSRLLLEESIYDQFIASLTAKAKQIKVGSGSDEKTHMGPVVSEAHMNKILSYIEIGKEEGAKLIVGGNRIKGEGLENGYFVEPTIFVDTTPEMRIVQEEIFGPVLVVQKFKDEAEALRLANDTKYGLAGAVFTNDIAKAYRVIKKVRAGITWINSYHPTYNEAPWGGFKQSGNGRELGTFGYEAYTEVKQINNNLDIQPTGWFDEE